MQSALFGPVIGLVLWSFVMGFWLYGTRISAVRKHKIIYDPYRPDAVFHKQLPPRVRWKADNYNNLMEQPTLFYAVVITLALLGQDNAVNLWLAWSYVVLRVVHSLVQAIVNVVLLRLAVFMAASIVLLVLSVRAALVVFG
jgi:hypothetical protein